MMETTNPASVSSQAQAQENSLSYRPLILAGLVLGLGQGGFFDGIVFHQLLQWHHMFSSIETDMTIAGMELNTFGDGLFHLFDWLLTLVGFFCFGVLGSKQRMPGRVGCFWVRYCWVQGYLIWLRAFSTITCWASITLNQVSMNFYGISAFLALAFYW
jgi:uncharacterized membrane protein